MILIKENKEKKRAVFYDGQFYYKVWHYVDAGWFNEHIELLKKYSPELIADYSIDKDSMTLKMNKVKGKPGYEFEPTLKFIDMIYKACIKNMIYTSPYMHGDWVLSNMIIDDDKVKFIDWDNLRIMNEADAMAKLHSDLKSAFVNDFERYLNDSASVQLSNVI